MPNINTTSKSAMIEISEAHLKLLAFYMFNQGASFVAKCAVESTKPSEEYEKQEILSYNKTMELFSKLMIKTTVDDS